MKRIAAMLAIATAAYIWRTWSVIATTHGHVVDGELAQAGRP